MLLHALIFVSLGIVCYTIISIVAQLLGAQPYTSTWAAFVGGFALLPAVLIVITNPIYGVALYHGFHLSRFAIPMILVIGAITSFVYSVIFLGASVTLTKVLGLLLAVAGIVLLAL